MKGFNFFTIMMLTSALAAEVQESLADKKLTVKEAYDLLGTIIDKLNLNDKILYQNPEENKSN